MDVRKITLKNGEEDRLVRIGNPWGVVENTGMKYRKKIQNSYLSFIQKTLAVILYSIIYTLLTGQSISSIGRV